MRELFWIDISDEKPEQGQSIFYLDMSTADWYERSPNYTVSTDDIGKGEYVKDNLVEWYCDSPSEEFKYWIPIPRKIK
jgi:hypothetical protein